MIRDALLDDAEAIASTYNHYVANSFATFEEQAVSIAEMERRMVEVMAFGPWLAYEDRGEVVGYAYAGKWKARSAYRFAAESSVYLVPQAVGRGIGTKLYEELLRRLRELPIHVVIGGVALPNAASVALHERLGFEKVAHFRNVGWKMKRWIDVGYWQLTLREGEPTP